MSRYSVVGVVNFYIHALLFRVLFCHLFQLSLDLHLGVEDRDGSLAARA